jgi:hypothetical protein
VDLLLRNYIDFLKANGRYDDAMIVVTGDHGEELQERGFWFHASALTREQTGVPVVVKWPKELGVGKRVAQGSHLDIVPSVMDALGCPPAQWAQQAGRSLREGGDGPVLDMRRHLLGRIFGFRGCRLDFGWSAWMDRRDRCGLPRLRRLRRPSANISQMCLSAGFAALSAMWRTIDEVVAARFGLQIERRLLGLRHDMD